MREPDASTEGEQMSDNERKKVLVRVTFDVFTTVPSDWDNDQIDFLFGGSALCIDTLLQAKINMSDDMNRDENNELEMGCACVLPDGTEPVKVLDYNYKSPRDLKER